MIEIKQSFLILPCALKKKYDQQCGNVIEDKEIIILFVLVSFSSTYSSNEVYI